MNPENFFPANKGERDVTEATLNVGEKIKINLETNEEVAYELGGIVKNELFDYWPDPEHQNLIDKLSGFYSAVTFEIVNINADGTIDIKPQGSETANALLRKDPRLNEQVFAIQLERADGRNLISDMANSTLFGVSQEFFSQYEAPERDRYEALSFDDQVVSALTDPEEFVNEFGNALAYELNKLPDEAQELIKQASRVLFTKQFQVDFIYQYDGETENPLVKIYCVDEISQSDITDNHLEEVQVVFDEKYGSDRTLLSYLQSSRMLVSASALTKKKG
jgi:hypothetical protein